MKRGSRGGPDLRRRSPAAAWLFAALVSWLAPFPLAGAAVPEVLELQVGDIQRVARVYPGTESDTRPSPLVIVFHGLADSAWNFADIVAFHEEWPQATVVYPEGLPREDRAGRRGWHGFRDNDVNQDMAFTDLLLETLANRFLVDPSRVYVTGFSNGGHMTFNLLLDRPCRFAAFAPVGALGAYVSDAAIPRPVIYLFGREEPREYSDEWQNTVVALARVNRATGEKREWAPGLTEFLSGPSGQPTVYGLYGAGHVWPSSGNELIIRFFRENRLDTDCGSSAPGEPADR